MAFLPVVCDGFDNYENGQERWTIGANFTSGPDTALAYSRHSWGRGAFINGERAMIEIPPLPSVILEGALQYRGTFQLQHPIISFWKLDVTRRKHASLHLSDSRHVYFKDANDVVVAGPTVGPSKVIEINNWYWWSVKVVFDENVGSIELKINGDTWLTATGLDTVHDSATAPLCDCVALSTQFGPEIYADDIVIQDGEGEFQGDMVVLGKRPADAGYITQFTPSAGSNWQNVDEIARDNDTTYNASSTVGERDSYLLDKITEVPDSSIVLAVQQAFAHRKTEPGPRSTIPFIRVASDEIVGEEWFPSETSYITVIETPQVEQPAGGDWGTVGDFNALDVEIGQEVADGEE